MRRLLALVVAVAMVTVSLYVRSRMDDDGDENGNGREGPLRLVCAAEFAGVCTEAAQEGVTISIEAAPATAQRLVGLEQPDLDGWVVTDPWPRMVDDARARASRQEMFSGPTTRLARSPLVLVVRRDRAAVLGPQCPDGQVGWKCLGEVAGRPWRDLGGQETWVRVKPAHGQPDRDSISLLVLGQAVASFFGTIDGLSSTTLTEEPFAGWFQNLERSISPPEDSGFLRMVTQAGTYDAVGTTEAEAASVLAQPANRDQFVLLYPSPMATADVVLAAVGRDDRAGEVREAVTREDADDTLVGTGWRVEGREPPASPVTLPALPAGTGLPAPGFLEALRIRWAEVV